MKNLIRLAFIATIIAMGACNSTSNLEEIKEKISNGKELTKKDYSTLINEAEKYSNEIIPLTERLFELGRKAMTGDFNAEKEGRKLGDKIDSINNEFQPFFTTLSTANVDKMGKDNYDKFQKLMEKNKEEAEKLMQKAYEISSQHTTLDEDSIPSDK